METTALLDALNDNQKERQELQKELESRRKEIKERLCAVMREAYEAGIRFYDADRFFFRREVWPVRAGLQDNESVFEFTHDVDADSPFVDRDDFPMGWRYVGAVMENSRPLFCCCCGSYPL